MHRSDDALGARYTEDSPRVFKGDTLGAFALPISLTIIKKTEVKGKTPNV